MRLTIIDIPPELERALRERAAREQKSVNEVAISVLESAVARDEAAAVVHHDLDWIAGTWVDDPAFDEAMTDFEKIDPELWK